MTCFLVAEKLICRSRASFSLSWKLLTPHQGETCLGTCELLSCDTTEMSPQVRHLDGTAVVVQKDIQGTGDLSLQAALKSCECMQGITPVGILFVQVMLTIANTSPTEHTTLCRLCPKQTRDLRETFSSTLSSSWINHRRHKSVKDSHRIRS